MIITIQLKNKESVKIITSDIIDNNFTSKEIWEFIWNKLSDLITKKIDKKNLKNREWYEKELEEYKIWNKLYLWFITILAIVEFIILIIIKWSHGI